MTHRLIIVRHGNTFETGEPLRRIGARTDLPLTAAGRTQADAIGRNFSEAGIGFDRVLTGPLRRTRDTADAIVAHQATPRVPEIADFLIEIDHGVDENALEPDVEARVGRGALDAWDAHGICPPGWHDDRASRIAQWHDLARSRPKEGVTLLVTSNGAARFALSAFALSPPSHKLRTGAWGAIDIDGTGDDPSVALVEWDVRP